MEQIKFTGGARIGMANATFPFVTLKVSKEKLELNATIIGNLVFQPKDIISIEPYLGQGIKINHRVANYKQKVIFSCFTNHSKIINQIEATGFLDNINSETSLDNLEIIQKQKQGAFPLKKWFAIVIFVQWNLLFAFDFYQAMNSESERMPFGVGVNTALGIVLGSSLLLLISASFRKLVMKEGATLDDIKRFLYFVILIIVMILIGINSMFQAIT